MTESTSPGYAPPPGPSGYAPPPTAPPPAPTPRPPLRRTTGSERVLGGVAAGIAKWLGIDPILVRVAFVVLAVFGGGGIVLYLVGWLFLPEEGQETSAGERFVRDNTAVAIVLAVILALTVVGPALAWGMWGDGPGFLGVILAVAAVAVVVAVARRDSDGTAGSSPPQPAPSTGTAPTQVLPQPPGSSTLPGAAGRWTPPPQPPAAPRERSALGVLTLGVALVVAGVLVALDLAGVLAVEPVTVLAAGLLVVALGLLVGTLVGRSRGLIALGAVLVLVLVPLAALPDQFRPGDGAGERTYAPMSTADLRDEYRLGAGELTLDLTGLDLAGTTQAVDVSLGVGRLVVQVPAGVGVGVDVAAQVGVGSIRLPGDGEHGGLGVERTWTRPTPTGDAGAVDLDLEVGLGEIVVETDGVVEVTR